MNAEDLTIRCEHELTESHDYHDPSHPDCDVSVVTGHGHHWLNCSGGRVPTQAEINALAKPDYNAALEEHDRQAAYGGHDWPGIVDAALGGGT